MSTDTLIRTHPGTLTAVGTVVVPVVLTIDRQSQVCLVPDEAEFDLHGTSPRRPLSLLERYLKGVPEVSDPDACQLWTRSLDTGGYGKLRLPFGLGGQQFALAHRLAWFIRHGNIPTGVMINHRCCSDSGCTGGIGCLHRRCVNPRHLELVTNAFNLTLSGRNLGKPGLQMACGHRRSARNVSLRAGHLELDCRICA